MKRELIVGLMVLMIVSVGCTTYNINVYPGNYTLDVGGNIKEIYNVTEGKQSYDINKPISESSNGLFNQPPGTESY